MTRHTSRVVAVVLLSLAAAVPAVAQVSPQRESQLIQQTSQFPRELAPYLELARMYFEQGRYEDAERVLSQSIGVVQRVRATSLPTPSSVPAQPAQRTMLTGASSQEPVSTTLGSMTLPPDAVRVGGGIREPRKIRDVKPIYPAEARAAKVSGLVMMEVLLDRDGAVSDLRLLRSEPLLDRAAVDAVRQWLFTQTLMNGVPVPVVMTVTVNFTLQ